MIPARTSVRASDVLVSALDRGRRKCSMVSLASCARGLRLMSFLSSSSAGLGVERAREVRRNVWCVVCARYNA